ncbi:cation-translocating P-type ATPase [Synechocystis sp. PCC 7338]|uniref:heavy metal translocating P-type ATPase n=1 Tax=Synechocystis sp. PCC 7338 TaxID=2732530 RepID=UPI002012DED5|nr:cation-translocating P-type ATPase [Synechocystis sp. PCC 7338]
MTSTHLQQTLQAHVGGMDCGGCARTIVSNLEQLPGIAEATVNFASERLQVKFDPALTNKKDIISRVTTLGYTVTPEVQAAANTITAVDSPTLLPARPINLVGWRFWLTTRRGQTVLLSGVGLLLGTIAERFFFLSLVAQGFYAVSLMVAIAPIIRAAWIALKLRRADMNLLMTLAAVGAAILGQWFQGALVIFLFGLGTTLQKFALSRTRNAIGNLMDLTPITATVKRDDQELSLPVTVIGLGEILTIRPGQRIALDGVVRSGESTIDQSPITGESLPEHKTVGDSVFGGTLNQTGFLEVEVTHTAEDTTVARIIHLVEEAQESRAPIQQWIDRFSAIYTPIVLALAATMAVVPPLVFAQPFQIWFYKALVLLVIACPCGLVIATPVSLISAIGAATRQGVLFKGGNALETAGKLQTLAFDKTGTITEGMPKVQRVHNLGTLADDLVLMVAASLEQRSEHPIAQAIAAEAVARGIELSVPASFMAVPGKGIGATLMGKTYFVGNRRLFADQGIGLSQDAQALLQQIESQGQTPVLVGSSGGLLGAIAVADGIRLESAAAVRQLERLGLDNIVMLTGDRRAIAQRVAQQVGIDSYQAELLPEDKLNVIQHLRQSSIVGMVGDGINDTPALAAADVSFAVGKLDTALETADVVLVGNDLERLGYAIQLSRRTLSVIKQNIAVALILNATFVFLGVVGLIGLPIAVLEDMGSSLFVTLNALRLFNFPAQRHNGNPFPRHGSKKTPVLE